MDLLGLALDEAEEDISGFVLVDLSISSSVRIIPMVLTPQPDIARLQGAPFC
jgi:hypothetical protein